MDKSTPEIYTYGHTISHHDSLPICFGRQVVGNAGRQADAGVHVGALGDVAGHARGHLVAGRAAHASPPVETRRCTKMPGVTTDSGSSSPSATTPDTWAMVHAAAIAISGPKLRAVLRYTRLPQRSPRCALIRAKSARSGDTSPQIGEAACRERVCQT